MVHITNKAHTKTIFGIVKDLGFGISKIAVP